MLATLPAAAIGFAFQHKFRALFASPRAAGFLILSGLVLFAAERGCVSGAAAPWRS